MLTPTTDEIAREAALLLDSGRTESIREAVRLAVDRIPDPERVHLRLPSPGRVREHLRGLLMQSMGEPAYQDAIRSMWQVAEEIMTVFEPFEPVLAGRAAKGNIDGGVRLHIRLYTKTRISDLADMLVECGYEEPAIDTINTRFGRLNRLAFEEDGFPVVITRCGQEMVRDKARNLFRDEPIAVADLRELRARVE